MTVQVTRTVLTHILPASKQLATLHWLLKSAFARQHNSNSMLNHPDAVLEYVHASFQEKQSQPQDLQRQGLSNQTTETESILGNMVHTAVSSPAPEICKGHEDVQAVKCSQILAFQQLFVA